MAGIALCLIAMVKKTFMWAVSVLCCVSALAVGQTGKHKVSPKLATSIALKKCPGKVLHAAKLEKEDGRWQYEVIIKAGKKMKEVNVDAETGKITSVETTSAGEEEKEAKEKGK